MTEEATDMRGIVGELRAASGEAIDAAWDRLFRTQPETYLHDAGALIDLAALTGEYRTVTSHKGVLPSYLHGVLASDVGMRLPQQCKDAVLTALARVGSAPDVVEILDEKGDRNKPFKFEMPARTHSREDSLGALEFLTELSHMGFQLPEDAMSELRNILGGSIPPGDEILGSEAVKSALNQTRADFEGRRIDLAFDALAAAAANQYLGDDTFRLFESLPLSFYGDRKRGSLALSSISRPEGGGSVATGHIDANRQKANDVIAAIRQRASLEQNKDVADPFGPEIMRIEPPAAGDKPRIIQLPTPQRRNAL